MLSAVICGLPICLPLALAFAITKDRIPLFEGVVDQPDVHRLPERETMFFFPRMVVNAPCFCYNQ